MLFCSDSDQGKYDYVEHFALYTKDWNKPVFINAPKFEGMSKLPIVSQKGTIIFMKGMWKSVSISFFQIGLCIIAFYGKSESK